MGQLDGRVAIVTGGARGIGAGISRLLVGEGAAVVVCDLGSGTDGAGADAGPAQAMAEELTAAGARAVGDGGDVADTATGERLVKTAVERFGKLDIVVNAAGILRDRMIFNMSEADWDAVIRVHLKGHFSTVRPASAYWREQRNPGGHYRIINFTSLSALHGSPGQPNYSAAKLGVVGLTYSLAQGLARYGVTANAISPIAATRLTATVQPNSPDVPAPDDIAPLAAYLASERSDWLSGRVLSAQGTSIGLWSNPQEIAGIDRETAWDQDALADAIEDKFRPVADGLPYSVFSATRG
ncbi:MAG TPA: SDR family NAD(P)-dependent oxidoreductase [Pseudonocardiaceae bacterium]